MWNSFRTDSQQGIIASITSITGGNGDQIHAYVARPEGAGPFPGVVLMHHLPGWDELYMEFTRRFAQHGYTAICPDLYCRDGHGTPTEIATKVREAGGADDNLVVADADAAAKWLRAQPTANGKVGVIGTCSGGRHALLAASKTKSFDACVDLWGGRVVMAPEALTPKLPVAPIDLTKDLSAPLLGLFGNDDTAPTPEQVDQHEAELKKHGKDYEFHRYDGAGHAFWYHDRGAFRAEQAMDAWAKTFAFFGKHLA
jgi:carboxymethylenebutenolidase